MGVSPLVWGDCADDVDDNDDDDDVVRSTQQLFQQNDWNVKERLRQYIGVYLDVEIIEGQERVYFSHPAIYDACLFVVDRKYPGFVWKHCKVVFEREEKQSHIRLSKQTVFISKHNTYMFLTQIVKDLKQGKFRHSLTHGVLRTQDNIDRLFTQLGDRLKDIVKAEEDSESFLYWVAQSDNQSFLKTVLDRADLTQSDILKAFIYCVKMDQTKIYGPKHLLLKNSDGNTVLHLACQMKNLGIIMCILSKMQGLDDLFLKNNDGNTALHVACQGGNVKIVKCLLANINSLKNLLLQNNDGNTALHIACRRKNAEMVKCILAEMKGLGDLWLKNNDGNTALHIACLEGQTRIFKFLLAEMNDSSHPMPINNEGNTALHLACHGGNVKMVKHLLAKTSHTQDLLLKNNDGNTALHMACFSGNADKAKSILAKTKGLGHLKLKNNDGNTVLHIACLRGNVEMLRPLLTEMECLEDLLLKNNDGETALHMAFLSGNANKVEKLLGHINRLDDVMLKNNYGNTVLHIACLRGNVALLKCLLNRVRGLKYLLLKNNDGNTALHITCLRQNTEMAKCLLAEMKGLGDLWLKNNEGNTALHIACLEGQTKLFKFLLAEMNDSGHLMLINNECNTSLYKAGPRENTEIMKFPLPKVKDAKNLPGQNFRTPVMMAALKGHGQLYEYLANVEKCQLTGVDDNGDTILHLACVGGNLNIVKQLVTGGIINKNQRGQHGKTPLMIAAYCKHKEMFDWLVGQKCDISPLDFSIKDLVSYGGVNHFTSLHVFLNSRELGINKVHRGSRYQCIMMLSSKSLEYARTKLLVKHLESKGSNMLFEDESGMSLLHTAANTGHQELSTFLLSKGNVDINIRDGRWRTPVMLAVAGGHGQMFDFLLDRGANLSLKDEISSGILHFACQGSNRSVIDKVMKLGFTDVNSKNDDMKTPLSYAVETGDKQIFNTVVNRGGDLLVVDRDKNTLLHLACKGGNLAIVEHLLSLGMFDIDAVNREHRTPLLVAAYSGHTDVCHHLICVGADLQIQDWDGNDVLLAAAEQGHFVLAEYILTKCKPCITNKDKSGKTAIIKAAEKGHGDTFSLFTKTGLFNLFKRGNKFVLHFASVGGSLDILHCILSRREAEVNLRDEEGKTPVMLAANNGHQEVFELLVGRGSVLSVVDKNGENMLHAAAGGGNVDIVQFILDRNIFNIESTCKKGRTPVMKAAENGHKRVFDLLVSKGADLTSVDHNKDTILNVACLSDNVELVKYLLTQNIADINVRGRWGRTPGMAAAHNGCKGVYNLLISKGADLSLVDDNKDSILHLACVKDNVKFVKQLLTQTFADINVRGRWGRTPVMQTAKNGCREVYDLLVSKGADLLLVDDNKDTVLHLACIKDNVKFVKHLLLQNLTDINLRGQRGRTPVMQAANSGCREVYDLLVSKGADLSMVDDNKDTILHLACVKDNVKFVKQLLTQNFADINVRGRWGRTPVMEAAQNGCRGVYDLLVRKGADLSLVEENKDSILHLACVKDNVEIVKHLLTLNVVDINIRGRRGRTPVMQAANMGCRRVFDLLVSKGADLSVVDDNKDTILHVACLSDNVEFVKYLLTLNIADINVRGQWGRTPVMQAAGNGCRGVFDLLVSKRADLSVVDDNKNTILNVACLGDNVKFVKQLLTLNIADINVRGRWGRTPVMQAAGNGCRGVFDLLVQKGADYSLVDDNKDTILNVACLGDNVEFVKYFLTLNIADINVRGQYGRTPVMDAASNGCRGVFDLLVSKGADMSVVDDENQNNILHLACIGGNVEVVKYILSLDTLDINSRTGDGQTPAMLARKCDKQEVFDLLVEKGGQVK